VGIDPDGQITAAGQVIVLPPVPSFLRTKVKAKALVVGFEKEKVQLPVRVAVIKFPRDKSKVAEVPVLPSEFNVSPYCFKPLLLSIIVVPEI
jgi:hypothetical protein